MHLKLVSAQNIKGRSFSDVTRQVTIWHGKNASGKTARINTVQVGLIGYLPHLGVQPSSTIQLASESQNGLSTLLEMDTGVTCLRSFFKKGEDVKRTQTPFPFEVPTPLIDQSEYLRLSADKRIAYVAAACPSNQTISLDELMADVKNLSFEPNTKETQAAIGVIVEKLTGTFRSGENIQKWIEGAIANWSLEIRAIKQNVDRMAKAIQAGVQLSAMPVHNIPALESKKRDVLARIDVLKAIIVKHQHDSDFFTAATGRKLEKQKQIDSLPATPSDFSEQQIVGARAEVERLATLHAELHARINEFRTLYTQAKSSEAQLDKMKARVEEIKCSISLNAGLDTEHRALCEKTLGYESNVHTLRASITSAQNRLIDVRKSTLTVAAEIEALKQKYKPIIENGLCPTCGHRGADLRALVKTMFSDELHKLQEKAATFAYAVDELTSAIATEQKQYDKAVETDAEMVTARKRIEVIAALITTIRAQNIERDEIVKQIAMWIIKKTSAEIEADAAGLKAQLAANADLLDQARKTLATLEGHKNNATERQRLESMLRSIACPQPEPIDPCVAAEITTLAAELTGLETHIKQAAGEQQNAINRKKAEAELEAGNIELMVTKAVLEVLKEYRSKLVTLTFAPMLSIANRIFQAVLGKTLEYKDGLIGYSALGTFVPSELFSGTEEAITQAAVSLALAAQCPFKVVIFDELGRLHKETKALLISTVLKLIDENIIHQFFGVDVDDSPYAALRLHESVALIAVQ